MFSWRGQGSQYPDGGSSLYQRRREGADQSPSSHRQIATILRTQKERYPNRISDFHEWCRQMIRPTTANLRKAEITVDFNAAVSSVPNKRCVYIVDFNIWVCLQVINGFYVYTWNSDVPARGEVLNTKWELANLWWKVVCICLSIMLPTLAQFL